VRYARLAGMGLLVGAFCAGAAAAHLLDGRIPLTPAALGCLGAGLVLLVGDLVVRRLAAPRAFWSRYFGSQASWSVRGVVPLWVLGFTLLAAALSFPSP
jgi:hypothetical protein